MVAAACDESICLITSRTTADLRICVSQTAEISSRERAHPLICLFKTGKSVLVGHSRHTSYTFCHGAVSLYRFTDVLIGNESR